MAALNITAGWENKLKNGRVAGSVPGDVVFISHVVISEPIPASTVASIGTLPGGFVPRGVCIRPLVKTNVACNLSIGLIGAAGTSLAATKPIGTNTTPSYAASTSTALIEGDSEVGATFSAAVTSGEFEVVITGDLVYGTFSLSEEKKWPDDAPHYGVIG